MRQGYSQEYDDSKCSNNNLQKNFPNKYSLEWHRLDAFYSGFNGLLLNKLIQAEIVH